MSRHHNRPKPHARRQPKKSFGPLLLVLGGVLLLGLTAFIAWRSAASSKVGIEVSGMPRLKVNREKVDLGDVRLGQTVEVSFEVANVGDQTLRFAEAPYVEVVEGC